MKQVYMDTFGCQMNVADSDRMELLLFHSGYTRTLDKEDADLILVNTCSIREKAEQKILSLFGNFKPLKESNPDLILGMTGCLGQQDGRKLLEKMPFIDFIMGPDQIEEIPLVVDEVRTTRKPLVWTEFDREKNYKIPELSNPGLKNSGPSAFVNIIKGCDKFCSFCVVPFTRGREKSREAGEILCEVRSLIKQGAREIILLGQNVNAYGKRGMDNPLTFHELLYRITEIPGLERLRFTTSHPKDFTRELVRAYRDIDILMNHLHLPVQSGNDRVLDEMRRGHTRAEYMDLIRQLKETVPGISLSTDIIVGFPNETESEFEDTLTLMKEVGFSSSFMFCYSPRPGTPAAEWPDTVAEAVKKERLQKTITLQNELTRKQGTRFVGKEVEVLVEGRTSRHGADFKGRSPQYWMVNFTGEGKEFQSGEFAKVEVDEVYGHALKGKTIF
ncbi:MAG: tRNA (N6-isopentenyl adenosine(37)-C2)-methylthiotransferase MiaB [Nitrospinota bacterium]|nr:tRNA (N6-isopentenyl adenosine(37)-C2)-methylthiotransferase MiaB [Nitrospinota bacterium]